jgi:hypothetical protein
MLLVEAAIQTACLILLVGISAKLFGSWVPGVLAATATLVRTRPTPLWENGMAALAAEIIFLCLLNRSAWISGAMAGVGLLISPALLLFTLPAAFFTRGGRYTAKVAMMALLVTVPWLARNAFVFHGPVFLRDSFGLELFISNNDLAGPRQSDAPQRYLLHPGLNATVRRKMVERGEPQYFSELQTSAFGWIRGHPQRFLALTAARVGLWWADSWFAAILSGLCVLGLWMFRRAPMGRGAAFALFCFPLPYYLIQFDPRYGYPIVWLLALFAGFAMWHLLLWVYSSRREPLRRLFDAC